MLCLQLRAFQYPSRANCRRFLLNSLKKKSELIRNTHSEPPKVSSEVLVRPLPDAPPEVEWKAGCGKELQQAIANRLNDMIGTAVRRVHVEAIIGPNILEFSLPLNYDVERKTLDRPESIKRLEDAIAGLVGQEIRVRFRQIAAAEITAPPTKGSSKMTVKPTSVPQPVQRSQVIEEPEDPYLQDVTKTFGVKNWKVKELVGEVADTDSAQTDPE